MGTPAGLDYVAMFQVADVLGIEITPAILTKIRALEGAVIAPKKGGQNV